MLDKNRSSSPPEFVAECFQVQIFYVSFIIAENGLVRVDTLDRSSGGRVFVFKSIHASR